MADTRERILHAAATLLAESGGEPVSTRAICQAAGVGAPTLYHHFGDKQGLFEAVAAHGFEQYLADKRALPPSGDPVQRLRDGWDLHVEFGLTHPAFYVVMYATVRPGKPSAGAEESRRILLGMLTDIAKAGRLRIPVDTAARMVHAASVGLVLSLIAEPAGPGDDLPVRTREALIAAITTPEPATGLEAPAAALRAALTSPEARPPLNAAETALLAQWLDRLTGP